MTFTQFMIETIKNESSKYDIYSIVAVNSLHF